MRIATQATLMIMIGLMLAFVLAGCTRPAQDDGSASASTQADDVAMEDHAGAQPASDDQHLRDMLAGHSTAPAEALPQAWRSLRLQAQQGQLALDEHEIPRELDERESKATDRGSFLVALAPPSSGVQINNLNRYEISVTTPQGAPVRDAMITLVGGMPLHGHGFPTEPAVGGEIAPGVYPLDGVRFGMAGWWQVILSVVAAGQTDTVTFDLAVKP